VASRSRDVTVNLPTLDQLVPPGARQEVLRQLALLEAGRIKRRTSQGIDANGAAFAPYSEGYADLRKRAGWSTKPDLWLRGGMLNALGLIELSPNRALIGFQGSSPKTRFAKRARPLRTKAYSVREKVGGVWVTRKKGAVKSDLTVKEGPGTVANALKAYWNQHGKKPRRFFAVSAEDRVFLARHALQELLRIAKLASVASIIRSRRTT
jgi:hypothetical protein